ncbi:uncharacterized protein [Bemisia tabaci]|uniref:uncharacterized protein n=1 Tax=Bemisia tabaci TaxID=7038 RepID=UPI003B28549C
MDEFFELFSCVQCPAHDDPSNFFFCHDDKEFDHDSYAFRLMNNRVKIPDVKDLKFQLYKLAELEKNQDNIGYKKPGYYVPCMTNCVFPKSSILNKFEMRDCYHLYQGWLKEQLNPAQHEVLMGFLNKLTQERSEFQMFVSTHWRRENFKRYLEMPAVAKQLIEQYWQKRINSIFMLYPNFYDKLLTVPLVYDDKENPIRMQHQQCLQSFGDLKQLRMPVLRQKQELEKSRLDSSPVTTNDSLLHFQQPVSLDGLAGHLAIQSEANFVLSSSCFKKLVDNHSPNFSTSWQLPIVVKEFPSGKGSKRIVFIDKALPATSLSTADKSKWFAKKAVISFLNSLEINTNNKASKLLNQTQPSKSVDEAASQKNNTQESSEKPEDLAKHACSSVESSETKAEDAKRPPNAIHDSTFSASNSVLKEGSCQFANSEEGELSNSETSFNQSEGEKNRSISDQSSIAESDEFKSGNKRARKTEPKIKVKPAELNTDVLNSQNDSTSVVKKTRGRPKKVQASDTSSPSPDKTSSSNRTSIRKKGIDVSLEVSDLTDSKVDSNLVVKKKRGRPKKIELPDTGNSSDENISCSKSQSLRTKEMSRNSKISSDLSNSKEDSTLVLQKKRGRPKKIQILDTSSSSDFKTPTSKKEIGLNPEVSDVTDSKEDSPSNVPKKRGRPKKIQVLDSSLDDETSPSPVRRTARQIAASTRKSSISPKTINKRQTRGKHSHSPLSNVDEPSKSSGEKAASSDQNSIGPRVPQARTTRSSVPEKCMKAITKKSKEKVQDCGSDSDTDSDNLVIDLQNDDVTEEHLEIEELNEDCEEDAHSLQPTGKNVSPIIEQNVEPKDVGEAEEVMPVSFNFYREISSDRDKQTETTETSVNNNATSLSDSGALTKSQVTNSAALERCESSLEPSSEHLDAAEEDRRDEKCSPDERALVSSKIGGSSTRTNVEYNLWTLHKEDNSRILLKTGTRALSLLIRTKNFGLMRQGNMEYKVNPVTKLEYNPEYGASCSTLSEATQAWADVFIKPRTNLIRVRVAHGDYEVMMAEKLGLVDCVTELKRIHNTTPQHCLNNLYSVLVKLADLEVGNYMLCHKPQDGAFAVLHKALNERFGSHSLQRSYQKNLMASKESCPFIPIDLFTLTPANRYLRCVPATFTPKFVSKRNFNQKKGPPSLPVSNIGRPRPRKNKGKHNGAANKGNAQLPIIQQFSHPNFKEPRISKLSSEVNPENSLPVEIPLTCIPEKPKTTKEPTKCNPGKTSVNDNPEVFTFKKHFSHELPPVLTCEKLPEPADPLKTSLNESSTKEQPPVLSFEMPTLLCEKPLPPTFHPVLDAKKPTSNKSHLLNFDKPATTLSPSSPKSNKSPLPEELIEKPSHPPKVSSDSAFITEKSPTISSEDTTLFRQPPANGRIRRNARRAAQYRDKLKNKKELQLKNEKLMKSLNSSQSSRANRIAQTMSSVQRENHPLVIKMNQCGERSQQKNLLGLSLGKFNNSAFPPVEKVSQLILPVLMLKRCHFTAQNSRRLASKSTEKSKFPIFQDTHESRA